MSTPAPIAARIAAIVFSGARAAAPRCPMRSTGANLPALCPLRSGLRIRLELGEITAPDGLESLRCGLRDAKLSAHGGDQHAPVRIPVGPRRIGELRAVAVT